MSAEMLLLRDAAGLMRERARKATPGPWVARTVYPHIVSQGTGDDIVSTTLSGDPAADAEYIASWPPPVALAVADWLDTYAEYDWSDERHRSALAVARAYLGGVA